MDGIGRILTDLGEAWERIQNKEKVVVVDDLAARMTTHLEENGLAYLASYRPGDPPGWEYQLPVLSGTYVFSPMDLQQDPLQALRQLVNGGRTLVEGALAEGLTGALEGLEIPYQVLYHPSAPGWPQHWEYRLMGYPGALAF